MKIAKYKGIFSKGYTKNWLREIFIINSVLKTNPWTYKIKDLNGEKLLFSNYKSVINQNQKVFLEIKLR